MVSLAIFDLINLSCIQRRERLRGIFLVQSSGALRATDLQCCDTWLKLIKNLGFRVEYKMLSSTRENMLHKISVGRQEMVDNSFLRDFRTQILSPRWAISQSTILRIRHDMFVSSVEKTIGFMIWIKKKKKKKKNTLSHIIYLSQVSQSCWELTDKSLSGNQNKSSWDTIVYQASYLYSIDTRNDLDLSITVALILTDERSILHSWSEKIKDIPLYDDSWRIRVQGLAAWGPWIPVPVFASYGTVNQTPTSCR